MESTPGKVALVTACLIGLLMVTAGSGLTFGLTWLFAVLSLAPAGIVLARDLYDRPVRRPARAAALKPSRDAYRSDCRLWGTA
jgi:4-hydroxybenzoate polyprenyltransferase